MSARSLTVQTLTAARRRARSMKRGVTMVVRPTRSGTWNSRYGVSRTGQRTRSIQGPPRLLARRAVASRGSSRRISRAHDTRRIRPRHARSPAPRAPRRPWRARVRVRGLELEDQRHWIPRQHLPQGRHAPALADRERRPLSAQTGSRHRPRQVGGRPRPDRPGRVRRPIERVIVVHDDDAVAREVDIELETVGAEGQPVIERRQRVFRPERGGTHRDSIDEWRGARRDGVKANRS